MDFLPRRRLAVSQRPGGRMYPKSQTTEGQTLFAQSTSSHLSAYMSEKHKDYFACIQLVLSVLILQKLGND